MISEPSTVLLLRFPNWLSGQKNPTKRRHCWMVGINPPFNEHLVCLKQTPKNMALILPRKHSVPFFKASVAGFRGFKLMEIR